VDREFVLAILVALLCGSTLTAAGWWPRAAAIASSGRELERRTWQRLWAPMLPAGFLLAALCGWAVVEPASAERVPNCLLWSAVPFAAVLGRAAWRAARSLVRACPSHTVATIGLLRPRIVLAPHIAHALDEGALAAALEHERAHVQHRDPLRLWIAQFGTDLLWPWPAAAVRFRHWRQALELARDEETRLQGIPGPDLAAAIVTSVRLNCHKGSPSTATLGGDASYLTERLARLMRPLDTASPLVCGGTGWLLVLGAGLCAAAVLGTEFGERVVHTLLARA